MKNFEKSLRMLIIGENQFDKCTRGLNCAVTPQINFFRFLKRPQYNCFIILILRKILQVLECLSNWFDFRHFFDSWLQKILSAINKLCNCAFLSDCKSDIKWTCIQVWCTDASVVLSPLTNLQYKNLGNLIAIDPT